MVRSLCEGQPSRVFLTRDDRTKELTPGNLFKEVKQRFKKGKIR